MFLIVGFCLRVRVKSNPMISFRNCNKKIIRIKGNYTGHNCQSEIDEIFINVSSKVSCKVWEFDRPPEPDYKNSLFHFIFPCEILWKVCDCECRRVELCSFVASKKCNWIWEYLPLVLVFNRAYKKGSCFNHDKRIALKQDDTPDPVEVLYLVPRFAV